MSYNYNTGRAFFQAIHAASFIGDETLRHYVMQEIVDVNRWLMSQDQQAPGPNGQSRAELLDRVERETRNLTAVPQAGAERSSRRV